MSYTEFEFRVFPLFIYYMFLAVFSIVITIKMFMKWRERKVKPPLYLTVVFALFTAAIIMLDIGLAEAVITGYYMEIYRFSLPFAYSSMVIADIFLYFFASKITNKGEKAYIPLIIIGAVICIVLFLPWNWWGTPNVDYAGKLNIRLYSTMTLILYSYVIYIYIAIICRKTAKIADSKVAKVGLNLLFFSMMCLIAFFVMMIVDTLLITLFDHPGYSEFVYLAWFFAILFYILSYLSLVMPSWLVKRIKEE